MSRISVNIRCLLSATAKSSRPHGFLLPPPQWPVHTGLDWVLPVQSVEADGQPTAAQCASHFCLETAPQPHSVVMCMQSRNGDMLGINARGRVLPPFVLSGQFWEHLGRLLERPWVGQNTLALSWCHIQCAVTSWNFFPSTPFPFHFPWSWTPAAWGPIPNTLLHTSVCIRLPFRRRKNQMSVKCFCQSVSGFVHFTLFRFHDSRYVRTQSISTRCWSCTFVSQSWVGWQEYFSTALPHWVASNNYPLQWLQTQTKCIPSSLSTAGFPKSPGTTSPSPDTTIVGEQFEVAREQFWQIV